MKSFVSNFNLVVASLKLTTMKHLIKIY